MIECDPLVHKGLDSTVSIIKFLIRYILFSVLVEGGVCTSYMIVLFDFEGYCEISAVLAFE